MVTPDVLQLHQLLICGPGPPVLHSAPQDSQGVVRRSAQHQLLMPLLLKNQ
jgi:hypothetical protein